MASEFTIRAVNDWRGAVHTDLSTALRVSMSLFGRTAEQACKHALILMAKSARALTPIAMKQRPVLRDDKGVPFIWVLRQGGGANKVYKWMAKHDQAKWERWQQIGRRGLAKDSWLWGLSKLKGDVAGYSGPGRGRIRDAVEVSSISRGRAMATDVRGYMMVNKLKYLERILPAGWLAIVEQKATNLIMKRAEMKMVSDFNREIGRQPTQKAA